jgi:hypothetical protein
MIRLLTQTVFLLFPVFSLFAQQIPAAEENLHSLVTFGKDGERSWGDDDFSQTFFFIVPKYQSTPVYIRIYDPECSGSNDEKKTEYNTRTKFSVYGGKKAYSAKDAQSDEPKGNYRSGNLLYTKVFGSNEIYDEEWYTFGPFNPTEGEWVDEYGGYIFKVICEGIQGDDGNLYRYFLSTSPISNKAVEGGNAFTFEYSFRLNDDQKSVAHLYPYVEENVVSVSLKNFDFDDDGHIKIVSLAKKAELSKASGDNVWATTTHKITEAEKKTTLDVQFSKDQKTLIKSNNVTLYVTNQYGNALPIYTVPIGGTPQHSYKIEFKQKKKTTVY